MEIDTNIISDEEFLREIFDKEKETKTNHASTDIEDELTSELKENIVDNDDINKKKDPAEETDKKAAEEAAKNVPAEYKSALAKATSYANTMHMSKQGVYDQLVSEYGEKFSAPAAQYAIDNVKADWNANALAKAKQYQSQQNMSPAAIHDQLTSSYGEKFTQAEADYAIAHL